MGINIIWQKGYSYKQYQKQYPRRWLFKHWSQKSCKFINAIFQTNMPAKDMWVNFFHISVTYVTH